MVTRTEAVTRINDGLGFRPAGHSLEPKIILRLQEAQRDLESGKTLPRFLIREDQTITLLAGGHSVALPPDFIREDDDNRLHFFNTSSDIAQYLKPKRYNDAVVANLREQGPVGPSIYVIRASTIDFITRADVNYVMTWNYFAAAQTLATDVENLWLLNAPEWIIGEAGYRIAKDTRDADAMQLFDGLRTQGRAACFGDIIADEDAAGPYIMGIGLLMGLEIGTWVDDLVVTNPPGGDDKRQGDDHLRLIKTVLKNTFKRASRPIYTPQLIGAVSDTTLTVDHEGSTIVCDTTSGPFTITLPTLDSTRYGWKVTIIKNTPTANPVYITHSAGINGYTKIRRSLEYVPTVVEFIGFWVASRPFGGTPVGSAIEYYGSVLPRGHLWADGASFTAADYVELNTALGTTLTPDRRGRVGFGRDNMGIGSASRLGAIIAGTTLQAVAGAETIILDSTMVPNHSHTLLMTASGGNLVVGTQSVNHSHSIPAMDTGTESAGHTHTYSPWQAANIGVSGVNTVGAASAGTDTNTGGVSANHTHSIPASTYNTGNVSADHNHAISGSTQSTTGGGFAHSNLPPAIICNVIVVAE